MTQHKGVPYPREGLQSPGGDPGQVLVGITQPFGQRPPDDKMEPFIRIGSDVVVFLLNGSP